jgi:hypothetical protein
MGKLIEKEGRFYKECRVVMLPTEKASRLYTSLTSGAIKLHRSSISYEQKCFPNQQNQHLYILSDDEIKEGDWYYMDGKIYRQPTPLLNPYVQKFANAFKIIATTDKLNIHPNTADSYRSGNCLPQPSDKFIQAFIDAYNKGEKIEKVLVEYSCGEIDIDSMSLEEMYQSTVLKPKLKDNNIIIKKVKDSWSRDEVEQLLSDLGADIFHKRINGGLRSVEKWIEENL